MENAQNIARKHVNLHHSQSYTSPRHPKDLCLGETVIMPGSGLTGEHELTQQGDKEWLSLLGACVKTIYQTSSKHQENLLQTCGASSEFLPAPYTVLFFKWVSGVPAPQQADKSHHPKPQAHRWPSVHILLLDTKNRPE